MYTYYYIYTVYVYIVLIVYLLIYYIDVYSVYKYSTSSSYMHIYARIYSVMTLISFVLSLCWQVCTPKPVATATYTTQQIDLLNQLVTFQCPTGTYNQVASLFMTDSDSAMQLLFHYVSPNGNDYITFSSGAMVVFFLPYFVMAAITSGTIVPVCTSCMLIFVCVDCVYVIYIYYYRTV